MCHFTVIERHGRLTAHQKNIINNIFGFDSAVIYPNTRSRMPREIRSNQFTLKKKKNGTIAKLGIMPSNQAFSCKKEGMEIPYASRVGVVRTC